MLIYEKISRSRFVLCHYTSSKRSRILREEKFIRKKKRKKKSVWCWAARDLCLLKQQQLWTNDENDSLELKAFEI